LSFLLRNSSTITDPYTSRAPKKLPFGEAFPNFHPGLVDFSASEEEIRVRNERNSEEKNMRPHISQKVQVQAAVISGVSVRLISLILVLLGIVLLLIANGGPP
jgi:hypothetical protein